ncbi:hypothetical protein AAII07_17190 [Microvirga sp. 0TCS3.31]
MRSPTPLLDTIKTPEDLCTETISEVSVPRGRVDVVELTVALHYVFALATG